MKKRKLNILFTKGGSGSRTTRLTLPVTFIDKLNITEDDREVNVTLINNKIIISKEEYKLTEDDLYSEYLLWRNQMEEFLKDETMNTPMGSIDCGYEAVREDFTAYAELETEITFEEMLPLEKRYNKEFKKKTW